MSDGIHQDDAEGDHEYPSVRAAEARQRETGSRDPVVVSDAISDCLAFMPLDYGDYLKTGHWKTVRLCALAYAKDRCQVCYSSKGLHVHHRTYDRLGCEFVSDLTVLCNGCHDLFHSSRKLAAT